MAIPLQQVDATNPPRGDSITLFAGYTLAAMVLFLVIGPQTLRFLGWGSSAPPTAIEPLTSQSRLSIRGLGPVRIGMSVAETAAVIGSPLIRTDRQESDGCYYVQPQGGPEGIRFMVVRDQIARIDVNSPGITSRSGAGVGTSEDQILRMYPGRLRTQNHPYTSGGHYISFYPRDPEDQGYAMIFETDGAVVTAFRAGRLPEVQQIESCL